MRDINPHEWLGVPENPPDDLQLAAGPLSAVLSEGRLLDIRYHGQPLIDEVYFALRDPNWGTIPYAITGLKVQQKKDSFSVSFDALHKQGGYVYRWKGHIQGNSQGQLSYEARGTAEKPFLTNRLGFCVLHAADNAGKTVDITHTDGSKESSLFPLHIAPHQPFFDIASMAHQTGGIHCKISFLGDAFECEDQRNWTDASFKTYCTPLSRPFPVRVEAGQPFFQSVSIDCKLAPSFKPKPLIDRDEPLFFQSLLQKSASLSLGACLGSPLFDGFKWAQDLGLHHVRVDLRFEGDLALTERLLNQAAQLAPQIHLAVFFGDENEEQISKLHGLLQRHPAISALLLYQEGRRVINQQLLSARRARLSRPGLMIGSGTDAYFTQLNREPLPGDLLDFVCYSNNPQVHAFDNTSIMQTTLGQMANVKSAKALYRGLPVFVSPITLKPRWNPDATTNQGSPLDRLNRQVDARQMSLFCASFLHRSLVSLALSGAQSATYFEIAGPRGLFSDESPLPTDFPMQKNRLYPTWHVLRQALLILSGPAYMHIDPFYTLLTNGRELLLSNATAQKQVVHLQNAPAFEGILLDEHSASALSRQEAIPTVRFSERFYMDAYSIFIGSLK